MILSLYNKQFLLKQDPRFIYNKLKLIFDKLKAEDFIFPEKFNSPNDTGTFYSYFENLNNFNELKINNTFFKPELLISKIELNHLPYLNDLNNIYNKFYYDLNYFSLYRSFITNNYYDSETNYFKFVFNNEDSNAYCYNRSPILNVVSYKFFKLLVDKYVSSTKYSVFSKVSSISKSLIINSFNNLDLTTTSNTISKLILKKILKVNNYSPEYFDSINFLVSSNIPKIKTYFANYVNKVVNSYYFINLNYKIVENLIEHITSNVLNYPKELIGFVKTSIVNDISIENFENNSFDFNSDNVIDDIWDPDDDNDYVNLLRKLNPELDNYYKSFFVVQDNKTLDKGGYLSHINILENQIFEFIKSNIRNRENETNSIFYVAAQFAESSPLNYVNSLVFTINNYINDLISSDLYEQINEKFLPDRVVNLLIKNLFIDNNSIVDFFSKLNFSKSISTSKAIDYTVFDVTSKLIFDFFDSDEFKEFLFADFFTNEYLKFTESRFPNVRDDLINNLNNLIDSFKFIFTGYIYDKSLFSNLTSEFYSIYNTTTPIIKTDDVLDIYENYLISSNIQIDDYRDTIKNMMISYTYSLYTNIFLDNFRINKKFSTS